MAAAGDTERNERPMSDCAKRLASIAAGDRAGRTTSTESRDERWCSVAAACSDLPGWWGHCRRSRSRRRSTCAGPTCCWARRQGRSPPPCSAAARRSTRSAATTKALRSTARPADRLRVRRLVGAAPSPRAAFRLAAAGLRSGTPPPPLLAGRHAERACCRPGGGRSARSGAWSARSRPRPATRWPEPTAMDRGDRLPQRSASRLRA